MPATGGGRAAHPPAVKGTEQGKSAQSMQPPRRESSAGVTAQQRPGMKTRACSAPNAPSEDGEYSSNDLDRTDEDNEGEEIADDAFFQRYHFPQAVPPTREEEGESSAESSSDTEGPLSPTHVKDRQPAGDAASEPSTGVSATCAPLGNAVAKR
jgi:hypothetical protein